VSTTTFRHNRIDLVLHHLRPEGDGLPLLVLHGLGERAPSEVPPHLGSWPGPVHALDLTGHGASSPAPGGGYTVEVLMADVDHALAHLGPATLVGRGLGAYVALLVAGARPELVRGAILLDGPGLAGGGPSPGSPLVQSTVPPAPPGGTPDPFALAELSRDTRPPDYASTFARLAATRSGLDVAVAVCGVNRPEWLAAVAAEPGVAEMALPDALSLFGGPQPAT
jgi:pimeloyl-ACP methyl ester carboxylesterase